MNFTSLAVILGLLAGAVGCRHGTPEDAQVRLARKYAAALMACDTGTMEAMETAPLKKGMTKEMVATIMGEITAANGDYKEQGEPRKGRIQGHDFVYIPCVFEHGSLDAKVEIQPDNKVGGIYMVKPGGL